MAAQLSTFTFQHTQNIRTIIQDGEPLFCLADVCNALELSNPSKVAEAVRDEFSCPKLNLGQVPMPSGAKTVTFITEPQLYFVMMRSRAKGARPFRQWIVNEVLPSIRKHGSYKLVIRQPAKPKAEHLTQEQMQLISRRLDVMARGYFFEDTFKMAAWAAIRQATGIKSPEPLTKASLPAAKAALNRILMVTAQYQEAVYEMEHTIANKLIRKAGDSEELYRLMDMHSRRILADTQQRRYLYASEIDQLFRILAGA